MEIIICETAGFCFGVSSAIALSEKTREEESRDNIVYTLGPLIHNHEVIRELESKGIVSAKTLDEIPEGSAVVIRAHGVGPKIYEDLNEKEVRLVDATCPFVGKIHELVRAAGEAGREVIIFGDPSHPEVIGIRDWCVRSPYIYKDREMLEKALPPREVPYTVVAQTTSNPKVVEELLDVLQTRGYDLEVKRTICSATIRHQEEAVDVAKAVDQMVVIGAKHSSNTRKLYTLCQEVNEATYLVETAAEMQAVMDTVLSKRHERVGITAGASTPRWVIQEMKEVLQNAEA